MNTNCLVTKLKAVVDNDNLEKLGELVIDSVKITVASGQTISNKLQVVNSKEMTIYITGNGYFCESQADLDAGINTMTTITIPAGTFKTLYFLNEDYQIHISEKYTITVLNIEGQGGSEYSHFKLGIDKLKYCKLIISLAASRSKIYGSIDTLTGFDRLGTLNIYMTDIRSGDISSLKDNTTLITMYLNYGITWKLSDLSNKRISVFSAIELPKVVEDIEDFVTEQLTLRTVSFDNPVRIDRILYNRFNGVAYDQGDARFISFESSSRIAVYGGGYNLAACTYVYEKGATAEEIAAWQAAGKTVTDVITGTVYSPTN